MALVIFPTTNYESFVSVANATTLISNNVIDTSLWTALTTTHKEIYLRQSTKLISQKIDLDLIEDITNLELATALLANHSIGKDMLNSDGNENLKVKDLSGVIRKEWFSKGKKSNAFPDFVSSLLSEYGYASSNSFKIARA